MVIARKASFSLLITLIILYWNLCILPCDSRKLAEFGKIITISKSSADAVWRLNGGASKKSKLLSKKLSKSKKGNFFTTLIRKLLDWVSGGKATKKVITTKNSGASSSPTSPVDSRLQKEVRLFLDNPPDNCELVMGSNIRTWVVKITGSEGTIYAGEKFKLKMVFPKDYPSKPPSVHFLKPTPRHVHVYSNGDICLNLLGRDWRPMITAEALVISIVSMLSSAKEKRMPQDNALHADAAPGQQQDNWMYHDDKC